MTSLLCCSLTRLGRLAAHACWRAAGLRTVLGLLLGLLALAARAQTQRPQLALDLQAASSSLTDRAYLYVEAGASIGYDKAFDAEKLLNPNNLNLASTLPGGQRIAIKGLPPTAFTSTLTVNLFVGTPQADTYSLVVSQLTNFSLATVYLVDAEQQTRQLLTLGSAYSFSLAANTFSTSTRFSLVFEPNSSPLPVTLVSFTAERQGPDGLLRWATATEEHSAYFQPESSPDGAIFTALGRVAAAGTTTQAHSYQFRDANLARYAAGQVYYRLRQVDEDGTSTFSPVRQLAVPVSSFSAEAFPTAVLPGQALSLLLTTPAAGPASLRITDATGRQVAQRVLALPGGTSTLALPEAGRWAAGLYLLRVQQGTFHQALKVVIQ